MTDWLLVSLQIKEKNIVPGTATVVSCRLLTQLRENIFIFAEVYVLQALCASSIYDLDDWRQFQNTNPQSTTWK